MDPAADDPGSGKIVPRTANTSKASIPASIVWPIWFHCSGVNPKTLESYSFFSSSVISRISPVSGSLIKGGSFSANSSSLMPASSSAVIPHRSFSPGSCPGSGSPCSFPWVGSPPSPVPVPVPSGFSPASPDPPPTPFPPKGCGAFGSWLLNCGTPPTALYETFFTNLPFNISFLNHNAISKVKFGLTCVNRRGLPSHTGYDPPPKPVITSFKPAVHSPWIIPSRTNCLVSFSM